MRLIVYPSIASLLIELSVIVYCFICYLTFSNFDRSITQSWGNQLYSHQGQKSYINGVGCFVLINNWWNQLLPYKGRCKSIWSTFVRLLTCFMDLRWCSCFTFCNSNSADSLFLYSNFISFNPISYVLCSCIKPCYFIFLNSYFRATVFSFGILATPATGICTFAFEVCYITFLIHKRFCISVLILKFLWPICVSVFLHNGLCSLRSQRYLGCL